MARIRDQELERLKEEISVVRLVEGAGVELKAHGADRIGRCPFHDDKTPSLVVSPKKNLWHCLGACQTGGSDAVERGVNSLLVVIRLKREQFPLEICRSPEQDLVKELGPYR